MTSSTSQNSEAVQPASSSNFTNVLPTQFQLTSPIPTANEIVEKRKRSNKLTKSTNGFILYRTIYLEELKKKSKKLSMTQLSRRAGPAWTNEPDAVKKMFKKLAEDVSKLLKKAHMESKEFVNKRWDIQTTPSRSRSKRNNDESKEFQFLIITSASVSGSTSPTNWNSDNIESHQDVSQQISSSNIESHQDASQQIPGSNFSSFVNNPPIFANHPSEDNHAGTSLHEGLVYSDISQNEQSATQNRELSNLTSSEGFMYMGFMENEN
ncbi:2596_t:CDS:1 [Ambispora leptoticha]|uniref:2596_t:CDS:1 n=1 Tax=Ambispora leptoticha TaxID=144679 RepID=A0A9N8VJB7_9GLOM|nr:2596_t:CDS:1 [Ambispora leptoticha]